jgi:Type II secretion system (T2SS), protein G
MKFVPIFCVVVLVTLVTLLVYPTVEGKIKRQHAQELTRELAKGFEAYKGEYGAYPEGDYEALTRALVGENPKKIVFVTYPPEDFNPQGVLIDPWGMRYHIVLKTKNGRPRVWSSGPNRIDEADIEISDDIVSWR